MKKLFTFLFCLFATALSAQQIPVLTFDAGDTVYNRLINIDTAHYHHNIWQVGSPHKTVFSSALSLPNVIITDTAHPYAANDTSVFILKLPKRVAESTGSSRYGPLFNIGFSYQLNIDSNAIARLEISEDSGAHWVDIKDSLPTGYMWSSTPVNLSLSTTGWNYLGMRRTVLSAMATDSVLFRFTFIAGPNPSSKDGWMIDNMVFYYYFESVPQLQNNNLVAIWPNPTRGDIYVHSNKPIVKNTSISVYDLQGLEVYKTDNVTENCYLNLSLPEGMYMLRYLQGDEFAMKRVLIQK